MSRAILCLVMAFGTKVETSKPWSASNIMSTIEKMEKLIHDVPQEHISDVQALVNKVFDERRSFVAMKPAQDAGSGLEPRVKRHCAKVNI